MILRFLGSRGILMIMLFVRLVRCLFLLSILVVFVVIIFLFIGLGMSLVILCMVGRYVLFCLVINDGFVVMLLIMFYLRFV